MRRVFQKALLQNSGDLYQFDIGVLEESSIKSLEVEFMVDTGAAMICLPTHIIQKLGLVKRSSKKARTANGTVERNIYSPVTITIWDREYRFERDGNT